MSRTPKRARAAAPSHHPIRQPARAPEPRAVIRDFVRALERVETARAMAPPAEERR
jgi:hypothetical protein